MNRKGFSLIELLVVVAIIGILAAVGVVAYSGYTTAAKINAIEAQHSSIIRFILGEKGKCEMGNTHQKLVTAASLNGTPHNTEPPCADFLNVSQMPNTIAKVVGHLIGTGLKNIVEPLKPFHEYSGGYCTESTTTQFAPGCTKIDCSTCAENKGHNIMIVTTCLKGSCSDSEVLIDLIEF